MKITPRLTIVAVTFSAGVFAAAGWSAHIGRKVWSPRVFAWRNFLKPQPIIEEQPNSPLRIADTRFYSFMSVGSSIGSVLKVDFKNVSGKPIHSFSVSYYSPDPLDTGSFGCQPQTFLQPEHLETTGISSRGKERVKLTVDFVQFADGDVWYADPPQATVNWSRGKGGFNPKSVFGPFRRGGGGAATPAASPRQTRRSEGRSASRNQ